MLLRLFKRLPVFLFVIACCTAWPALPPVSAARGRALQPALTLSPTQGTVGTPAQLDGSGFPAFVAVYLQFGQAANGDTDCRDAQNKTPLPVVFSDESGSFQLSFMLPYQLNGPSGTMPTLPGQYCILATSAPGLNIQTLLNIIPTPNGATGSCGYVLGFATLHSMIPTQVGTCADNVQYSGTTGDALQHTSGGLLVWRKADNWTAFTDGYRTWVNGPFGIQTRLNSQAFFWEGQGSGAGTSLVEPLARSTIEQYFALLDKQDYAAAYAMWHASQQSYEQFVAGYADTLQASVRLGTPQFGAAAGSYYASVPTVIIARHTDGSLVAFKGCYVVRTLNPTILPPGSLPEPWHFTAASIQDAPNIQGFNTAAAQQALEANCL